MRKTALLAVVFFAIFASTGYGQFSFGVSPGFNFNNANFGYKFGDNLVPFIGLQYYNANFTVTEKSTGSEDSYSDETKLSAGILAPNIGLKYFIAQENKVKLFLTLNLTKPFISGKLSYNGAEDPDFQEVIDNTSIFGAELSFGMEYFFDENFSIGGEFGVRYLNFSTESSYYDDWDESQYNYDMNFIMSPTFAKISLNYYFSK